MAGTNFKVKNGLEITSGTLVVSNGVGTNGQVLQSTGTGVQWVNASSASGDVVGPASSTDNAVVRFDSTTGKLIQNSTATLSDGGIMVVTELNTDSIKSSTANSPIVIAPDGTGDVHLNADSVRIGDNNVNATIATNGTGDLILTTHEGSAVEGIVRLYDGANGNITLTPNGTGQVQVGTDQVVTLTASQTLTNKSISGSSNTLSNIANASTTATSANTASAIVARDASGDFSAGTITANLTGNASGSSGSTTGNAATATALQTARAINGVNFDGTAAITVTAAAGTLTGATLASGVTASSLTSVGTLGSLTVSGNATFDTNTLFVDATNNRVGISSTTPAVDLEIGSNTSTTRVLSVRYSSVPLYLSGGFDGTYALSTFSTNSYANATGSGQSWSSFSNTGYSNAAVQLASSTSGSEVRILTAAAANTNPTERVRIDSSGNVGIGTSSPGTKLQVNSGSSGADSGRFTDGVNSTLLIRHSSGGIASLDAYSNLTLMTGGSERVRIDSSGNVGIGTASPSHALDVRKDSGTWEVITLQNSYSGSAAFIRAVGSGGGSVDFGASVTADTFIIRTASAERVSINSSRVLATVPFIGNSGTKGFGGITTTTSTSTPTGGSSGDHYYIY